MLYFCSDFTEVPERMTDCKASLFQEMVCHTFATKPDLIHWHIDGLVQDCSNSIATAVLH